MLLSPKILLVEDDRYIASTLATALKSSYDLEISGNGKLALYKADITKYDAVILDLNLPDISGLDVCRQLRERGIQAPILILSGESRILTKINLLDAGANDYLTKPFSLGELTARLRALLRQDVTLPVWPKPKLNAYGIFLDRRLFKVKRDDRALDLRRKEFEILECMMENAGSLVTRKTLMQRVWNGSNEPWANTLDVHIKYLRDKLDKPFKVQLLQTIHGRGYVLGNSDISSKPKKQGAKA
jgi:two-component system OmpR family response regulator